MKMQYIVTCQECLKKLLQSFDDIFIPKTVYKQAASLLYTSFKLQYDFFDIFSKNLFS